MTSSSLALVATTALMLLILVSVSTLDYADNLHAEKRYQTAVCVDKIWPDYKGIKPCD